MLESLSSIPHPIRNKKATTWKNLWPKSCPDSTPSPEIHQERPLRRLQRQGAEFVEAEAVQAELADLAAKPQANELKDLLPRPFYHTESPTDPLLSIQITEFKNRGGLVIGVSVWHKIFDAYSIGTFISAWSKGFHSTRKPYPP